MGTVRDGNVKDQTEAEEIRRSARIHRRTIQNRLNDPDNHHSVVTHLESDILESKVSRWTLGSISTKAVHKS